MNLEYTFELLNDQNIEDLPVLFKNAFNEDRSADNVKSKYDSSKTGGNNFTFIAYDSNNNPSGLYAIFPVYINYNNENILAGQVGDILIHSDHKKSFNLFSKLANHAHDYAKINGVKLLFSFVCGMNGSYPALIRYIDFIDDECYNGYNLKINTLPFSSFSKRYSFINFFFKSYFLALKKLFFKNKDSFLHFSKNVEYNEIEKNNDFIKYKQTYSNCEILEIKGVRFLIKLNKDGSLGIGDVDKCSVLEIKSAIKKIKKIAFFMGVRIVQFEVSKGHILDQILSSDYSVVNERRLIYLTLDENIDGSSVKFTYSDLDTF